MRGPEPEVRGLSFSAFSHQMLSTFLGVLLWELNEITISHFVKYFDTSLAPSNQYKLVTVVNNLVVIYGGKELSLYGRQHY